MRTKKISFRIFSRIVLLIKYVSYFPAIDVIRFRSWCYKFLVKKFKNNFRITDGVTIIVPEELEIGEGVSIHENSLLGCHGGVKIGDFCALGNNLIISTSEHIHSDSKTLIKKQGIKTESVEIGKNVWIGARVTILSGVKIGENSIIGASSLVNKHIPPNTVYAGVPAKFLKNR